MKHLRIFESEQIRQQALAQIDYGVLSLAEGVLNLNKAGGSAPQGVDHYIGTIIVPEGDDRNGFNIIACASNDMNFVPLKIVVDGVELQEIQSHINLGQGQHTIEIWDDPENTGYYSMYADFQFGYFGNCDYNSIIIPDYVTGIGDHAFESAWQLTSITIPNSVTSIGGSAFNGCYNLTEITIPSSVTSIGGSTFYGCDGLHTVHCEATIPPTIDDNVFDSVNANLQIFVPNESVDAYKTAWPEYADRIVSANEE